MSSFVVLVVRSHDNPQHRLLCRFIGWLMDKTTLAMEDANSRTDEPLHQS
ncbi:MAG TPA: hypothetical protein V6D11_29840 [Waterburya sp.]